jgi:molybdate transport system substrate-binding protein
MVVSRSWTASVFLTVVVGLVVGGVSGPRAFAQATIVCPPPAEAPADASPAASDAPPAVELVPFPADGGEVTVFAAASLTASFEAIAQDLEAAHPGLTFTFNFAGSQGLVTQLTEGAEADVFASANLTQMGNAVEADVISGEPVVFAKNRLAIVVPADNPAGITGLADLAIDGVDLVLAAPEVPVGQYAHEAACKAAADPAIYGAGFLEGFAGNIVSHEDNVNAVLAKVQLGEAEAGIVYVTDVTPEVADDVLLIEIPDAVNVIAEYPVAPVAEGDAELAAAFIAYLLGAEGQATLAEFGFRLVASAASSGTSADLTIPYPAASPNNPSRSSFVRLAPSVGSSETSSTNSSNNRCFPRRICVIRSSMVRSPV